MPRTGHQRPSDLLVRAVGPVGGRLRTRGAGGPSGRAASPSGPSRGGPGTPSCRARAPSPRVRAGPDRLQHLAALADHDALLRVALDDHGGVDRHEPVLRVSSSSTTTAIECGTSCLVTASAFSRTISDEPDLERLIGDLPGGVQGRALGEPRDEEVSQQVDAASGPGGDRARPRPTRRGPRPPGAGGPPRGCAEHRPCSRRTERRACERRDLRARRRTRPRGPPRRRASTTSTIASTPCVASSTSSFSRSPSERSRLVEAGRVGEHDLVPLGVNTAADVAARRLRLVRDDRDLASRRARSRASTCRRSAGRRPRRSRCATLTRSRFDRARTRGGRMCRAGPTRRAVRSSPSETTSICGTELVQDLPAPAARGRRGPRRPRTTATASIAVAPAATAAADGVALGADRQRIGRVLHVHAR